MPLSDIERWIRSGLDAGHTPALLLREMCRQGWEEETALSLLGDTLTRRLKELDVPLDRTLIDSLPCFPWQRREFLTPSETERLLTFAEGAEALFGSLEGPSEFWVGRTILPTEILDPVIVAMLRDIRDRMINLTRELLMQYVSSVPTLYADVINFARWPVGYALEPHADRENPDGSHHPYHWREFAAVVYLNTDFEGGETWFPNLDLTLSPAPGSLLIFPSGLQFLHGVKPVRQGMRHTIASFLTFDSTKEMVF